MRCAGAAAFNAKQGSLLPANSILGYSSAMGLLAATLRRIAAARNYQLVSRDYNSPIPYEVPDQTWSRRDPLRDIDFDLGAQIQWMEQSLAHARDWTPPIEDGMYGPIDAALLYGAVRALQPAKVIELGSGTSSEIIRAALGRPHDIYDPYANDRTSLPVERLSATDVPLAEFEVLERNDILFVDTTHIVKTGGDVVRIFLEILPILSSGVVVHVHDIFLPFEYPKAWHDQGRWWTEQYLLQAFLIGNRDWRVLCGCAAVASAYPERVAAAAPTGISNIVGGAFWMQAR